MPDKVESFVVCSASCATKLTLSCDLCPFVRKNDASRTHTCWSGLQTIVSFRGFKTGPARNLPKRSAHLHAVAVDVKLTVQ